MKQIFIFSVFLFCGLASSEESFLESKKTFYKMGQYISLHEHVFPADAGALNASSYVELIDLSSGRTVFKVNSPPFQLLWISEDKKYVVGLSNIKAFNKKQLVVYSFDGKELFSSEVSCDKAHELTCSQSMYSKVYWFDENGAFIKIKSEHDVEKVFINDWVFSFHGDKK